MVPMNSKKSSIYVLFLSITSAAAVITTIRAQTGIHDEDWPSSLQISDLMHTEAVIMENLRNYVNALDNKIMAIKTRTLELQGIYDVALNDTSKYFGNPINTFQLMKRMSYGWAALRDFASKDVTGHILQNITKLSEVLAFPSQEDLDEVLGKLVRIEDIHKVLPSQLDGDLSDIKSRMQITWADCLRVGKHSIKQGEYAVARNWVEASLKKLTDPTNIRAHIKILETKAHLEYKIGNIKEALDLTNKILELNPDDLKAISSRNKYTSKFSRKSLKAK